MATTPDNRVTATGGCLCGAVRYEIIGDLRGIVNCHCSPFFASAQMNRLGRGKLIPVSY